MASWHPVDVSQFDRDDIEDLHDEWDDDFKSNLDLRYNKLRGFDRALNESTDEDNIEMTDKAKDKFKHGTIELVANRIYDRLTILLNPISTGLFCLVVALGGGGGCFPPPSITPLSLKLDCSNFVRRYFQIG